MTEPIRVLELRCADGPGGGPEKTILHGAARSDPSRFAITVCYLRHQQDADQSIRGRAEELCLDYCEIRQRGPLDVRAFKELQDLVRARQIDIVHVHDYKTDFLGLWLARSSQVILVATAHGWTGHSRRERCFYYPLDLLLLTRYPIAIAVSGQIRDILIKHGTAPDRIRTIVNGIDHQIYRQDPTRIEAVRSGYGLKSDEVVIGAVGRLEPQKRFDLLLQAFALLRPVRPGLRLLIAGEGSCRSELESQADSLGLNGSCRLLGHCANVIEFFQAINVCVQSSDYEGTSNVVLEAMAMEVPVVATAVGGTAEIVEDGVHGIILPPRDPVAMADAIAKVLDEPEATEARVRAARSRVETELSFQKRQQRLEAVYEELVESHNR
ncbi:glycosyltransferase [Aquisphaera insulae]|uniref:glycosyltransferase n=1 Tax=Aquisphaera insulae TaxID=2712864 RepID=UPI00202F4C36|nr:glycosyltransferase [Aquisphaera insulae]